MAWVNSGEIAILEIQRPFVWDSLMVRDLMGRLYQGYPVAYIIAWRNPSVKLKVGGFAEGKKVLIDGQQLVTALPATSGQLAVLISIFWLNSAETAKDAACVGNC